MKQPTLVFDIENSSILNSGYSLALSSADDNGLFFFFAQGDEADCMYFVEDGTASVRVHNQVSVMNECKRNRRLYIVCG